jgi:hypothetical protein
MTPLLSNWLRCGRKKAKKAQMRGGAAAASAE